LVVGGIAINELIDQCCGSRRITTCSLAEQFGSHLEEPIEQVRFKKRTAAFLENLEGLFKRVSFLVRVY
jgi:hypothetical protein